LASAATWYISTTGTDDTSHGTTTGAGAWKTLNYALTGSRVAKGDSIKVEAGTYNTYYGSNTRINPVINNAVGTGTVTVEAYPEGATVIMDMPTNTNNYTFLNFQTNVSNDITFKHIKFTNSNSVGKGYFWLYAPSSLTFEDCEIDSNTTAEKAISISSGDGVANLTIRRSVLHNISGSQYAIGNINEPEANITIESSVIYGFKFAVGMIVKTNLVLHNSTIVALNYPSFSQPILNSAASSSVSIKNNIFYTDMGPAYGFIQFSSSVDGYLYAINNPDKWVIKNNVYYNPHASPYDTTFPLFQSHAGLSSSHVFSIDGSNHFLDPLIVSTSTFDFRLSASSLACGHGEISALPATDINGESWFGNDVGAYKCSSDNAHPVLQNKVAFAGDSISASASSPAGHFTTLTGISASDPTIAAWSGGTMVRIFSTIDGLMSSVSPPNTIFLEIGVNDFVNRFPDYDSTYPTSQEYANYITSILDKINDWGATPIWIGNGSFNNNQLYTDEKIHEINELVEANCVIRGYVCGSYLDQMMLNPLWQSPSPDGYYDIAENVHPNSTGKNLMASTAAYLYYSPQYSATSTPVQHTGNIKIYKSGKYRYTSATSSSVTADFAVAPVGDYDPNNYSDYLDVVINTWDKSGDQNKSWTASSSVATSTTYTIGDLVPNVNYTFKLDGSASTTAITDNSQCTNGVCMSDDDGKISFTYVGGYSTHTFELVKVPDIVVTPEAPASHSSGNSVQSQISNLNAMGNIKLANELKAKYLTPDSATSTLARKVALLPRGAANFTRDLKLGTKHSEVKLLQQFLNTHGYPVDTKGLGSLGNETTLFGKLTQQALIKFQTANKIKPAKGYFGAVTRKVVEKM